MNYLDRPILLTMVGRSGSSMIAGIFAVHKVWTGRSKPANSNNAKGYFENIDIKRELQSDGKYFNHCKEYDDEFAHKIRRIIHDQGYKEGPWMMKFGASYHKMWQDFDPFWIKIKRNPEAIHESFRRANMLSAYSDDDLMEIIKFHHTTMDSIPGVEIWSDDVVNGNYGNLRTAFERCDLEFDSEIADEFVDGSLWHHS